MPLDSLARAGIVGYEYGDHFVQIAGTYPDGPMLLAIVVSGRMDRLGRPPHWIGVTAGAVVQRRTNANVEELLLGYLTGPRAATANRDLERYLDSESFTGRKFADIADFDRPNEGTANDLVAVSMLGVNVPARCAIWILGEGRFPPQ